MAIVWKSPDEISSFVLTLAEKNHYPRLENATFAVAFDDSKPFVKNKFNFSIVLSSEVWVDVLNVEQREALLDLHLSSCVVEYVPQTVQEGKKKKVVKDDWGRIQYTDEIKLDDNSTPKWYVTPLDFSAFAQNVSRYGLWCTDFCEIQDLVPKNQ
jgi:hypothetical protein